MASWFRSAQKIRKARPGKRLTRRLRAETLEARNMLAAVVVDDGDAGFSSTLPTQMIDDGGPGYSESGTWYTSGLGGVEGDSRYAYSGASATFNFSNLAYGDYQLLVNTPGHENSTTSARYTITNGSATSTQYLNQVAGTNGWLSLGTFSVTNGYLRATVSNASTGVLRADAMQLVPVGAWPASGLGGYQGDSLWSNQGSATYVFEGLTPGVNEVAVQLPQHSNSTTSATYTIVSGSDNYTVNLNQRTIGSGWVTLGSFHLGAFATVTVTNNNPAEVVRADAVRISRAVVNVTASEPTINEAGETSTTFVFTRDTTIGSLSVGYQLSGTADLGDDYTGPAALQGTVLFANGSDTAVLTVKAKDDDRDELDQTIRLDLSGNNFDAGNSSAIVAILDDDPLPEITLEGPASHAPPLIPEGTVVEGDRATFTIRLAAPVEYDLPLRVRTIAVSAIGGTDYEESDVEIVIPRDQLEFEVEIQTLVDRDSAGENTLDINEPTNRFTLELSSEGEVLDSADADIDDDFTVVDAGGGPYLLARSSIAGPFLGGINPLNSDSILTEKLSAVQPLPLNGKMVYLDDWTPVIPWLYGESWSPFYNPVYDAGIRTGEVMTHGDKPYYFKDLQDAADGNEVGSKEDFASFLKKAKEHYELDQLMIELRTELFSQNNATHKELLKLIDTHYFKTGYGSLVDDNFDKAKQMIDSLNEAVKFAQNAASKVTGAGLEDAAITLLEAKLVTIEISGGVTTEIVQTTTAYNFNSQHVLVARGDGTFHLFEFAEFQALTQQGIDVSQVEWKVKTQIEIPDIPSPTLQELADGLDTASKALQTLNGSLSILNGLLTEDQIESLDVLEGILTIGGTYAPPGISDIFEMYGKMVGATQSGLEVINFNLVKQNVQNLTRAARENWLNIDVGTDGRELISIGLQGIESTLFSFDWLKANSDFFDNL